MSVDKMNPAAAAGLYKNVADTVGKAGVGGGDGVSFGDLIKDAGKSSLDTLRKSEEMSAKAISGDGNIAEVVNAITQAEVTLQTIVAVRDRMMSAYQEIMRMPI